jgi:prevent-host-death family protein
MRSLSARAKSAKLLNYNCAVVQIRPRLPFQKGDNVRSITSADAKNNFGELIDLTRAAPVTVTKYDRPVLVMMAVEEFERFKTFEERTQSPIKKEKA